MTPALLTLGLAATATWMLTADPMHKFNHAASPPVISKPTPKLPVKSGTTDAVAWRMALNEAAVMISKGGHP